MASEHGYRGTYFGQLGFVSAIWSIVWEQIIYIGFNLNRWLEPFPYQPAAEFSIALDRVQREGRSEQTRKASPFLAFIHRHLLHDEFVGDGFQSGAHHKLMLA